MTRKHFFLTCISIGLVVMVAVSVQANSLSDIKKLIGDNDSLLVADPEGTVILSKNIDMPLTPASILKTLTSLVAIHHLGMDFRFITEFYVDRNANLKIKGYGDPLLVSEVVNTIAESMATKINYYNDLTLDASYFDEPLTIPGISSSFNPYDAPNGALCVNFNTVHFKYSNGKYISGEPQTPLLPMVLDRIEKSGMTRGRIVLSNENEECLLYAGGLFQYFLKQKGIDSKGVIRIGKISEGDRLIHRYIARYPLSEVIAGIMEFSNNFTTNQVLIAVGAKVYGPPGTLDKGVRAVNAYVRNILKTDGIQYVEGSGLSRQNQVTARAMHRVLEQFEPYHELLRFEQHEFYKTGTLNGVRTRVGYIQTEKGALYRFVVMLNTDGKSTEPIMNRLKQVLY